MAGNTQETWIRSGPARDALEAVLRQEGDRDARRRVWLTEDMRRQVAAPQANFPAASVALAELFPSWFGGIDPSSEQQAITEDGPLARYSPGSDFRVARDSVDSTNAIRPTDIRQPTEPRHRFMKLDSSWVDESNVFNPADLVGLLVTHGRQTVRGGGISSTELLAQYNTTLPVALQETNPDIGDTQFRDLLSRQTGAGDEFKERWGIAPRRIDSGEEGGGDAGEFPRADRVAPESIHRGSHRDLTGRPASVDLMMSQPFARDQPLSERAIDAALSGVSPPMDSTEFRLPPTIAGRSLEGKRGADSHFGPMAEMSASSPVQHAMAAVVEELERLRAAARRTADELEKVRGLVPPAFPARPPVFHGRL